MRRTKSGRREKGAMEKKDRGRHGRGLEESECGGKDVKVSKRRKEGSMGHRRSREEGDRRPCELRRRAGKDQAEWVAL